LIFFTVQLAVCGLSGENVDHILMLEPPEAAGLS